MCGQFSGGPRACSGAAAEGVRGRITRTGRRVPPLAHRVCTRVWEAHEGERECGRVGEGGNTTMRPAITTLSGTSPHAAYAAAPPRPGRSAAAPAAAAAERVPRREGQVQRRPPPLRPRRRPRAARAIKPPSR